jgi:hypothetical protein
VLKQIDKHKEDRGYWFSSLSNFFRLLGAFFTGSLATEKRRIAKDFTKESSAEHWDNRSRRRRC